MNTEHKIKWISIESVTNIIKMNSLIEKDGDCLLLFDNGEITTFSEEYKPAAIITHFAPICDNDKIF